MPRLRSTIWPDHKIISLTVAIAVCLLPLSMLHGQSDLGSGPTSLQALNLGLSDAKQSQLIQGWNTAMASGDVSVVIAAINLLDSAPPELRAKVLDQSRQSELLPSLFRSLNAKQKDQLVSSLIHYPDVAVPLGSALSQELLTVRSSSENLLYISNLVAVLKNIPPGSPEFFTKLLKLEHASSDVQVRQTYAALLLAHFEALRSLGNNLKPLLNSSNSDEQQLAVRLMLKLNFRVPEKELDSALNDKEGLQPDAIRYLGTQPEPLTADRLKVLIPVLAQPDTGTAWVEAYSVLQKKQPALLQTYFSQYKKQFDALSKLSPSILIQILNALPAEQSSEIATWPLPEGGSDYCEFAIANLMLLKRKADVGVDFGDGLWKVLQGKQSCSGQDQVKVLDLVDTILTSRPTDLQQFSSFLTAHTEDQHWDDFIAGVTTFSAWQDVYRNGGFGTSKLQLALAPALRTFMDAGKATKALALLQLGVPFSVDAKAGDQLLSRYHNKAALLNATVLEMLGRLGQPPRELASDMAAIASDATKDMNLRKAAIDALAIISSSATYYSTFLNIASGPSSVQSVAAINALTRLYEKTGEQLPSLSPSDEWLRVAATDQYAQTSSSRLLEVLALKKSDFGPLLLRSIPDPTGYRCWDLAALDTVSPKIWLTILDNGLGGRADQLDSARACVMLITGNLNGAGLISSALTGTRSENVPQSGADRAALLSSLSDVWDQTEGLSQVRRAIANQVDLLSPFLPYDVASQRQLHIWSTRLGTEFPD